MWQAGDRSHRFVPSFRTRNLLDYKHIHVQQICRARMGNRTGVGTLETVVFGRHAPSGFKSILDGAP